MPYLPIRNSGQLAPSAIRFRSRAPSADLAGLVTDFWQYDVLPSYGRVPIQVSPSGCVVLRFDISADGVEPILYGPSLRSEMKGFFVEGTSVFGVAFGIERARAVLECDISELRDRRLELATVWPTRMEDVCERLWNAERFTERIEILSRFLRHRFRDELSPPADLLHAVSRLTSGADSRGLCDALRVSDRTLRRYFDQDVGLGPKHVARVVRVQRTMRVLAERRGRGWSQLALDAGFSDQPHFNREFKRLLGMRPGEFATNVGRFHDPSLAVWQKLSR